MLLLLLAQIALHPPPSGGTAATFAYESAPALSLPTTISTGLQALKTWTIPQDTFPSSTLAGFQATCYWRAAANVNSKLMRMYLGPAVGGRNILTRTSTTSSDYVVQRVSCTVDSATSLLCYVVDCNGSGCAQSSQTHVFDSRNSLAVTCAAQTLVAAGDVTLVSQEASLLRRAASPKWSAKSCATRTVLTYGDSKTVLGIGANNNEHPWQFDLWARPTCCLDYTTNLIVAANGTTTAARAAAIAVDIAALTGTPDSITYNLGSNDAFFGDAEVADEAAWKANVATIWDAMHAEWPAAQIYYSETWRQGYDVESDRMATWYAAVAAGRDYVHLCDNERDWVKGSDDGATMFWDGIHFSYAGAAEKARLAAACLGF